MYESIVPDLWRVKCIYLFKILIEPFPQLSERHESVTFSSLTVGWRKTDQVMAMIMMMKGRTRRALIDGKKGMMVTGWVADATMDVRMHSKQAATIWSTNLLLRGSLRVDYNSL